MTHQPVFYDPSGFRKRWSLRGMVAVFLGIVIAAVLFATTLVDVPAGSPLAIGLERPQALRLGAQVARAGHHVRRGISTLGGWLPRKPAAHAGQPLTVGFYVPWDPASLDSLRGHLKQIDWVVPALAGVSGPDHALRIVNDPGLAYLLATAPTRPHQLTMVQNLDDGAWDGPNAATLLHDPAARARLIQALVAMAERQHAAGLCFDFENLPAKALPDYVKLLTEANKALDAKGLLVTVTIPADDPTWPLAQIAAVTDRLFLMDYDQHWQGGTAGPIAAQPWFIEQIRRSLSQVPRDKLIVALGSYGYDWHGDTVDAMTVEEALDAAHDSSTTPQFDPDSGNSRFAYEEEDGESHNIWLMDAAATWNQLQATRALGVNSVALWRLGSEDPGVWTTLDTWRQSPGTRGKARPDLASITPANDVDVEHSGEILRITATPTTGKRRMTFGADGLIHNVVYDSLPTPYVVSRTGAQNPKLIALTFDDGPDSYWTPRILDVLKAKHVPATFFVIGENAVDNPGLMRRLVAEGHEIGNHSYTHPNMAQVTDTEARLEFNTTQRVIEAYTGHSTRLFRAPYFGDAEPTTADEIGPALAAQQAGYTVVGLHVDPEDWQRPGVDAIINTTMREILEPEPDRSANIVLLHDGGGDRTQTLAALPQIIDRLRAKGYTFVPVSQLAGLTPAQVMPKVTAEDLAAVRFDVGIFRVLSAIGGGLVWLFFLAIALGMARAVLMTILAVTGRNHMPAPPMPGEPPFVSVIIPAYNEERVIEASVRRVLESEGVTLEVIVADDGSKDRTSAIVREVFGHDPRVQLLTLVNGGKAAALNRALKDATAPVIVALDADTQFEPLTIARLARWFADPDIGAVAGNAKVGNRVNLVTKWQAVEYVTAQNVERRALARFDAMMVVPGAVGAWRREALDDVGGYPEDTLAEDQDLTIAIQRDGWRVAYDVEAVAWTEAPESFKALAKQRYRWAFGTLQCLWKHGRLVLDRRPAGLALVGVPQTWLFQIVFAAISPLIDTALIVSIVGTIVRVLQHGWAQTQTDVFRMGLYWLIFTAVDLACGWTAYALEKREKRFPGFLLLAQRFVYRQVMYWVVLRAIGSAVAGFWVGWGKLERTGRTRTPTP
ncbi:polysaccharide deacetylase family protein [Sphingomonas sp.]|uniref:polysaccharide deacetylase family protein n=1 Tax=Sphingomonas sp. TaxID=28214 RepID=UPI001B100111|nr:polysaccharide deacetylase family protein [Sphingomonas sp.]MBO9712674.1 glycosyltransferase [Sphingomonas sp.]